MELSYIINGITKQISIPDSEQFLLGQNQVLSIYK